MRPTDNPLRAPTRQPRVTPELLDHTLDILDGSAASLSALSSQDLLDVWNRALSELRDPTSPGRQALDPTLEEAFGLSPPALQAALECMVDGVVGEAAAAVFRQAGPPLPGVGPSPPSPLSRGRERGSQKLGLDGHRGSPILIVLASNLPGLVVQALLPALAARRPVLIKSARAEPLLAPWLIGRLIAHQPKLRPALAALTWRGGDRVLEDRVLSRVSRVIAYGGGEAMDDLRARCGDKLVDFGPKISLAILGVEVEPSSVVDGLARDIALFEQRGCLSVQAVVTFGDGRALADALARSLGDLAVIWPRRTPQGNDLEVLSAVHQLRDEALMRGLYLSPLPTTHGSVIVEDLPVLEASPGGRCVRIYEVASREQLLQLLEPWRGRLQGVALSADLRDLEPDLVELGVSRCARPGALQQPDTGWRNGGVSLLEVLGEG